MCEKLFDRDNVIKSGDHILMWPYLCLKYSLYENKNFYHYTDVNGFLGIINNHEFWLSHIKYMNDSAEYIEGENICKNLITNFCKKVNSDEKDLLTSLQTVISNDKSLGLFSFSRNDIFSISFTRDRDSLDMWRGYGKSSGIAIGFDAEKCNLLPGIALVLKERYETNTKNKTKNEMFFNVYNIIYNNELKEKIITDVLDIGLEFYRKMKDKDLALKFLTDSLFSIFPFMKNQGFKNENECRFIDNISAASRLSNLFTIEYRERSGIILPFIKYQIVDHDCNPIVDWPINEIVVGPSLRQKDLANSIRYFLIKHGYDELAEKVVLSSIPYKP